MTDAQSVVDYTSRSRFALRLPGGPAHPVTRRLFVAGAAVCAPDDVSLPAGLLERPADGSSPGAALNNVVGNDNVLRPEAVASLAHRDIYFVIDQRVKHQRFANWFVVRREFGWWNDSIAISDVNRRIAALEIVAEDFVIVAEKTDSLTADEIICIDLASVSVANRYLRRTLAERIESIDVVARFVADAAAINYRHKLRLRSAVLGLGVSIGSVIA